VEFHPAIFVVAGEYHRLADHGGDGALIFDGKSV
jgi:hypothetical protein